jgi:hypothetical protein
VFGMRTFWKNRLRVTVDKIYKAEIDQNEKYSLLMYELQKWLVIGLSS